MENLPNTSYSSVLDTVRSLKQKFGSSWNTIVPANAARMATQNRFKTGLDIAKYTATIMRRDMTDYCKQSYCFYYC